jgi:hypothetical protein
MRYGAAKGRLGRCFFIDMDKLMVFRAIGELINTLLIQCDPVANTQLRAY